MKTLGGHALRYVGKIFDATNADGNIVESSSFDDAIAADVANEESSYAGALAGTAQVITGWAVVIFFGLGFLLAKMPMGKKKRSYKRRRKTTTTRRTYKRRKK